MFSCGLHIRTSFAVIFLSYSVAPPFFSHFVHGLRLSFFSMFRVEMRHCRHRALIRPTSHSVCVAYIGRLRALRLVRLPNIMAQPLVERFAGIPVSSCQRKGG
jgi:hypothetical protein